MDTNDLPRIVAVDYGTRRVGVAISDPLHMFARPFGTFSPDEAVKAIEGIHRDTGIACLLVGWPLTPDGDEGPATDRVQEYINRLARRLRGVLVLKVDERSTSRRAVDALVDAGVGRKGRRQKERIDAAAAAILLQDYLEQGDE
jgi:putative holliday junction resolvase